MTIFLSHAGEDLDLAKVIARHLRNNGFDVWLDADNIAPGEKFISAIESGIAEADCFLLYVGNSGVRRWVDQEVRLALIKNVDDQSFKIFPVLGPGASESMLPLFLRQYNWLDLRDTSTFEESIERLVDTLKDDAPTITPRRDTDNILSHNENPFRGLQYFDTEHSHLFFGRDTEIGQLIEKLKKNPITIVIGDSGSGKSSLVRAGLIPALHGGKFQVGSKTNWRIAICRLSESPFERLSETLPTSLNPDLSAAERIASIKEIKHQFLYGDDGLRNAISGLVPKGHKILIFIDQFEELYSFKGHDGDELFVNERNRFVDLLIKAGALEAEIPVHILITIRSDYYQSMWEHPRMPEIFEKNHFPVKAIAKEEILKIIEMPARLSGVNFEPGLVKKIMGDVGNSPGQLALLELLLFILWEKRDGALLSHKQYDEIGGVSGALNYHAEAVYLDMNKNQRRIASAIFLRLTRISDSQNYINTRRQVSVEQLLSLGEDQQSTRQVINYLSDKRLIVIFVSSDTKDNTSGIVEISHEVLINHWARLKDLLEENRKNLLIEKRLIVRSKEWAERNHTDDLLYRGVLLSEVRLWKSNNKKIFDSQSALVKDFYDRSLKTSTQQTFQKILRTTVIGIFSIAIIALVFIILYDQNNQKSDLLLEQGRAMLSAPPPQGLEEALAIAEKTTRAEGLVREALLAPRLVTELGFIGDALSPTYFEKEQLLIFGLGREIVFFDLSLNEEIDRIECGFVVEYLVLDTTNRVLFTSGGANLKAYSMSSKQPLFDMELMGTPVTKMLLSATNEELFIGTYGGIVYKLSTKDGEVLYSEKAHNLSVTDIDGAWEKGYFISGSLDGTTILWKLPQMEKLRFYKSDRGDVRDLSFNSKGNTVFTCGERGHKVRIWDVESSTEKALLDTKESGDMLCGAFSKDGRLLAVGSSKGTVYIWNLLTGNLMLRLNGSNGQINNICFLEEDERIMVTDETGHIVIWDANSGKVLSKFKAHPSEITQFQLNDKSNTFVTTSSDQNLKIWSSNVRSEVTTLLGHKSWVRGSCFTGNGQLLATGDVWGHLKFWDCETWELEASHKEHTNSIINLIPDYTGDRIASLSEDQTIIIWNTKTQEVEQKLAEHEDLVFCGDFHPDKPIFVSSGFDKKIIVWNLDNGAPINIIEGHSGWVRHLKFTKDGKYFLSTSDDGEVKIWETVSGKLLNRFEHEEEVWDAHFLNNDLEVVTACHDGVIRIWDRKTGKVKSSLEKQEQAVYSISLSSDEKYLVSSGIGNAAIIWNIPRKKVHHVLEGHENSILDCLFSPDGKQVITVSEDNTVKLWMVGSGALISSLSGHTEPVEKGFFSQDGRFIVTTSRDHTVKIYISDFEELHEFAKAQVPVKRTIINK